MTGIELINLLQYVNGDIYVETPAGEQMCSITIFDNAKGIPCLWIE